MSRTARRRGAAVSAIVTAVTTVVLTAAPAWADHNPLAPQEGADEHAGITIGAALLLYGLLPLVLLLVTAAVVWLPGVVRGASRRYRPGAGWDASPVWFAGPGDPVAAVEAAPALPQARGGAGGDW